MKLFDLAVLDHGPGRALLEATVNMGFSQPVAMEGLRAEVDAWLQPGAIDALHAELPSDLPDARLPKTMLVIAASTLPASTMRAVFLGRLLGAKIWLKPAHGQEDLATALHDADPDVEPAIFGSNDGEALADFVQKSDTVVVLGSDETVSSVRLRVPADTTFVGYGHRVSGTWLEDSHDKALMGLAEDICAWDQAGCLSPQVAWVADPPEMLAPRLMDAICKVDKRLPICVPPGARRARQVMKTLADMKGKSWSSETALVCTLPDPSFRPCAGFRSLWLLPMDTKALNEIAPYLSTLAYCGPPSACPELPGARICNLGDMQRPPLTWLHDGRKNLPPLLRAISSVA